MTFISNPCSLVRINVKNQLLGVHVSLSAALLALLATNVSAAVLYVDSNSTNPTSPFTDWTTAATNIQDAVDAAVTGDTVLVTNGIYSTGGKSMDGVITNRVAVNKAIVVQSVNGPGVTVIQGAWDPVSTNGPAAVRCVAITNLATLTGFTLRAGATRPYGTSSDSAVGGGLWHIPGKFQIWPNTNVPLITNCIITGNSASGGGGGAVGMNLVSCILSNNSVNGPDSPVSSGGGAAGCLMTRCLIIGNTAHVFGGGAFNSYATNCAFLNNVAVNGGAAAYSGALVNCTVVGNISVSYPSSAGGAVANATLVNCIVYKNLATWPGATNYGSGCTFSYSDADPLPPGVGNIDIDPQLLGDNFHLSAASPCLGAGTNNVVYGTDIDGQPWKNPPSIGCDEWQPPPVIGTRPRVQVGLPTYGLTLSVSVGGQAPFTSFWSKDGALIQPSDHYSLSGTDLVVNRFSPDDAGVYQVIVTNAFGVATSQVAQVVIHAVSVASLNPVPPYSNWATAATNIQDAIEASSEGDIVLVTNGVYAFGGKVKSGDLTNRVALDKAVTVTSANGFAATVIEGAWDPSTDTGPQAVRCAWLTERALLIGFTLRNGGTRASTGFVGSPLETGGGVWCSSNNAIVSNCLLTNNIAIYGGAGAYGTLNNCLLAGNRAAYGGGSYFAGLNNCTVVGNFTTTLFSTLRGAGTYEGAIKNSIVLYNFDKNYLTVDNHAGQTLSANYSYCCTDPLTSVFGPGNIDVNPQFLDLFHISSTSPCRGTGSSLYAAGTDLDGEPWVGPPSIGCDEVIVSNLTGSLSVAIKASTTNALAGRYLYFSGLITGLVAHVSWSFGDGPTVTNVGVGSSHAWAGPGDYEVIFTAYNTDNPSGVSANIFVHISPVNRPQIGALLVQSNGFQFQFPGEASVSYTVQSATNLAPPVDWQSLQYVYAYTGGVYVIKDSSATNGTRFYRVIAQ